MQINKRCSGERGSTPPAAPQQGTATLARPCAGVDRPAHDSRKSRPSQRIPQTRAIGRLDWLENGRFRAHIVRMEKYRSRMLEVVVTADQPPRWEWQVRSNGTMIANGFADEREKAKFEGNRAMFLLLAAGWNL
jgi:hypothetical protein